MCIDTRVDMRINMCIDMRIDMCIDLREDMCMDMFRDGYSHLPGGSEGTGIKQGWGAMLRSWGRCISKACLAVATGDRRLEAPSAEQEWVREFVLERAYVIVGCQLRANRRVREGATWQKGVLNEASNNCPRDDRCHDAREGC